MEREDRYSKNKKILFIGAVVLFILVAIAIVVAWLISAPKTATIEVTVAPSDATILIGGKKYRNGTYKIEPGDYSVDIQKDNFSPYASEFTVKKDEIYRVIACLNPLDGNNWYDENKEDSEVCRTVAELASEEYKKDTLTEDIFSVVPYHSYDDGFNIDAALGADGEKTTIKISLLSCREQRREALKENALTWLKNHNVDVEKYEIEYVNGCQ